MKLTNQEILTIVENLTPLMQDSQTEYPAAISYSAARNFNILSPIAEDILEERMEIIKTHSEVTYDAQTGEFHYYFPNNEEAEAANKALKDLLAVENEVNITKFYYKVIQEEKISMSVMNAICFMVEVEGEG
jgi:hypothetical protein